LTSIRYPVGTGSSAEAVACLMSRIFRLA